MQYGIGGLGVAVKRIRVPGLLVDYILLLLERGSGGRRREGVAWRSYPPLLIKSVFNIIKGVPASFHLRRSDPVCAPPVNVLPGPTKSSLCATSWPDKVRLTLLPVVKTKRPVSDSISGSHQTTVAAAPLSSANNTRLPRDTPQN
ncbi:hypothetical protein J6590_063761 [Homalodisca vitripennis]|nr:hypothetical protein J6590_063761 [Homalodisca vitripennis]